MIEVTSPNGTKHLIAVSAIVSVTEGQASSQWHGIKAYLKLANGATVECRESYEEITRMIGEDE